MSGDVVHSASLSGPSPSRGKCGPVAAVLRLGLAFIRVLPLQDPFQKLVDPILGRIRWILLAPRRRNAVIAVSRTSPNEFAPRPTVVGHSRVVDDPCVHVLVLVIVIVILLLVGGQRRPRVGARVEKIAQQSRLLLPNEVLLAMPPGGEPVAVGDAFNLMFIFNLFILFAHGEGEGEIERTK
jgi:hypothetical protein